MTDVIKRNTLAEGRVTLHIVSEITMLRFRFAGTFESCIKICNNNAEDLISLLTSEFKCYEDIGFYNGNKGRYY